MNAYDKIAAAPSAIATQKELLQRLADRRPKVDRQLTPSGGIAAEVQRGSAQSLDQRITTLKGQLDGARERLETAHTFSRLAGHARVDFDRCS